MKNERRRSNHVMRLWTRQKVAVLEILDRDGVYRVKKSYIQEKFEDCADLVLPVYRWYARKVQEILPGPEGAEYPIWLSMSHDYMLQPTQDTVILELEVEARHVMTMDTEKWGYIVNYWYLPQDEEDAERHAAELKKYNIHDESSIYTSPFYPQLKAKIVKSWDRLFDDRIQLSPHQQAT
ncbi:hypothetical protein CSB45_10215, partial [candidate division KSB3 bacterium]